MRQVPTMLNILLSLRSARIETGIKLGWARIWLGLSFNHHDFKGAWIHDANNSDGGNAALVIRSGTVAGPLLQGD
jgi:hypothetical protein